MTEMVLDTSIAIAWYINESFSAAARAWQIKMSQGVCEFYVPDLHYLEFSNVLRTLVMRNEIAPPLAHNIYALHLKAPIKCLQTDYDQILKTAFEYGATSYDAAFIQMSISHNIPLLTAEKANRGWVQKMGKQMISLH